MRPRGALVLLTLGFGAVACTENTAPGNDREAELSPPEPAAETASAGAAIEGVATGSLVPGTMTDADLQVIPDMESRCLFRFTRVGLPVLAYGSNALLKLNDKLVTLPATAEGRYAEAGVEVTVRPLSGGRGDERGDLERGDGAFAAEFVLRLPGASDERGYHGFSRCDGPGSR